MQNTIKTIPITQRLSAAARAVSKRRKLQLLFGANAAPLGINTSEVIALPKLAEDSTKDSIRLARGEADLAALCLRHHNSTIHSKNRPLRGNSAAIFDALELMRIQLLGGQSMKGVAHNLGKRLENYCESQGYGAISERADPPVADILALLLREQITAEKPPASIARLVELWRPWAEHQGLERMQLLAGAIANQEVFAKLAYEMIQDMATLPDESGEKRPDKDNAESDKPSEDESSNEDDSEGMQSQSMPSMSPGDGTSETKGVSLVPMMMEQEETEQQGSADDQAPVFLPNYPDYDSLRDSPRYHAYTRKFDEVVFADSLASSDELSRLRLQLDQKLENLRSVTNRLSARLGRLLLAKQAREWKFEQEEGLLNNARLTRAVINPNYPFLFKTESEIPFRDTVVTLLLDNSGSMRGRPITVAAVSADILARTLERCGVKVEILGFTTRDWKGGQSRKAWLEAGRPVDPGRLNDLRHIIYKSADMRWNKAKKNLGLMLKDGILKENIDGESILWAFDRLKQRSEQRKILMVISDGAPVDDSTLSVNTGNYLDSHLRDVIHYIENASDVELLAIGIGHDVTRYYSRAVTISDVEQLGTIMVAELSKLFKDG